MNTLWLRIRVWIKVALFAIVSIYLCAFVLQNLARPVTVWLFLNHEPQTSVLVLSVFCFLLGVVGTLLVRTTFITLRQIRELRAKGRSIQMERELAGMKAKAARLQTRNEARAEATAEPTRGFPVEPLPPASSTEPDRL